MPFEPGKDKTGGRQKGVTNKSNAAVREMLSAFVEENIGSVKEEFDKLEGKDKIKAFTDLLPYVIPKLQSTSIDFDIEKLTDEQLDELYEKVINAIQ